MGSGTSADGLGCVQSNCISSTSAAYSMKLKICLPTLCCEKGTKVWMAWLGVNAGAQDMIHIDMRHFCVFCSKKKK